MPWPTRPHVPRDVGSLWNSPKERSVAIAGPFPRSRTWHRLRGGARRPRGRVDGLELAEARSDRRFRRGHRFGSCSPRHGVRGGTFADAYWGLMRCHRQRPAAVVPQGVAGPGGAGRGRRSRRKPSLGCRTRIRPIWRSPEYPCWPSNNSSPVTASTACGGWEYDSNSRGFSAASRGAPKPQIAGVRGGRMLAADRAGASTSRRRSVASTGDPPPTS